MTEADWLKKKGKRKECVMREKFKKKNYVKMVIKIRINGREKEVKLRNGCRVRKIRDWAQLDRDGRRTVCGRHHMQAFPSGCQLRCHLQSGNSAKRSQHDYMSWYHLSKAVEFTTKHVQCTVMDEKCNS